MDGRPRGGAGRLMAGTSVSILIPTHRDAHLLQKSLPVFLHHSGELEIVILNNDPAQDVSAAIGPHGQDRRVRIVEMAYGAGFARAINRGIHETSGELVMFCNADLFPSPAYVAKMVEFFERWPSAGCATGKVLRYDLEGDRPTEVIDTAGLLLNRQRRFMPRGEGERDVGQFDEESEVFGIDGAAALFRRSALESIRYEDEFLDESFFAHKEDHDISWRLRLAGWQCWYVPAALAYHARTTRGLGSTGYLSAIRRFHRNELEKSRNVQVNAMKNQWLMLLKNEDPSNFARDFPFVVGRDLMIFAHHAVFAPRALVAVPMTLRLLPATWRKRRFAKRRRRMDPRELRRWLESGSGDTADTARFGAAGGTSARTTERV